MDPIERLDPYFSIKKTTIEKYKNKINDIN